MRAAVIATLAVLIVVVVAVAVGSRLPQQATPAAPTPPAPGAHVAQGDHTVVLHIAQPDDDDFGLDLIEDPLDEVVARAGVGYFDGHLIGPTDAEIYFYGPDADQLYATMEPLLPQLPFPAGSYAVKQYGPAPDARQVRVALPT